MNLITKSIVYGLIPSTIDFVMGKQIESKQLIKEYIEGQDSSTNVFQTDSTLIEGNNDKPDSLK